MKVLVACEFSGIVRDAFIARGHDAISCDLLPTERPGPHVQGDVLPLLRERWDLVIAHPPCTYLCIMSACIINKPGRKEAIPKAAEFFLECLSANAKMVAVENPRMHSWGYAAVGRKQNFFVQPWEFGHPYTKKTGFWTQGILPPLMPTRITPVIATWVKSSKKGPYGSKRTPKDHSRTFPGIAEAMADQWGNLK